MSSHSKVDWNSLGRTLICYTVPGGHSPALLLSCILFIWLLLTCTPSEPLTSCFLTSPLPSYFFFTCHLTLLLFLTIVYYLTFFLNLHTIVCAFTLLCTTIHTMHFSFSETYFWINKNCSQNPPLHSVLGILLPVFILCLTLSVVHMFSIVLLFYVCLLSMFIHYISLNGLSQ